MQQYMSIHCAPIDADAGAHFGQRRHIWAAKCVNVCRIDLGGAISTIEFTRKVHADLRTGEY